MKTIKVDALKVIWHYRLGITPLGCLINFEVRSAPSEISVLKKENGVTVKFRNSLAAKKVIHTSLMNMYLFDSMMIGKLYFSAVPLCDSLVLEEIEKLPCNDNCVKEQNRFVGMLFSFYKRRIFDY